jgi:hypothetical protein
MPPAEASASDHARTQFPTQSGDARKSPRDARAFDNVLVKKLREYWQLAGHAQSPDRASTPPPVAMQPEGTKGAQPLPGTTGTGASPGRWPEVTGRQLARKLDDAAASAPGSFKRVQQTVHDTPEKVEIQNIFNVEVRADGGRAAGFSDDFSESIADLLREQAIQHGIDLT